MKALTSIKFGTRQTQLNRRKSRAQAVPCRDGIVMNRRIFLETTTGAAALLMGRPNWIVGQEKTALSDEDILAQARSRIIST